MLEIHQKSFVGQGLCPDPMWELIALTEPPSCVKGVGRFAAKGRRGRKKREGEKKERDGGEESKERAISRKKSPGHGPAEEPVTKRYYTPKSVIAVS